MKPVCVVAAGAISALGRGEAAYGVGPSGGAPRSAIGRDPELAQAGLRRPFAARVAAVPEGPGDRAARLLGSAARDLASALDRVCPGWRGRRLALLVGTSGGGMPSLVQALARRAAGEPVGRDLARAAPYFGPLDVLPGALGVCGAARIQILAACASSTMALGLATRWLELGHADLVIAGGYDALSPFIAAGFEALGASSERPAPFRVERNGMALGEGAALLALARAEDASVEPLGWISGFGASSDAVHVTAPDREGKGLARAARGALVDAGLDAVEIVSAHGTATPYNDAAEARALDAALGEGAKQAVVHPFKGVIGHTLGAAGALELLAGLDALGRGLLPASVGSGAVAPELEAQLLERNQSGAPRACLKLSAAFGGANAALVATRAPAVGPARPARDVRVGALGAVAREPDVDVVARASKRERAKLARLDPLSGLAATAVALLLERSGELPAGTGVVVGSVAATLELDELFDRRCRQRGHAAAEPRRFPPTSPNLCAGECSIAFELTGPSLTVGSGPEAPLHALLVAHDLVCAGDAPAMLVVAADHIGPVVSDLWSAAGWPLPAPGAAAALLGPVGAPLPRARVADALAAAQTPGGEPADPGWPTLLRILER